MFLHVYSSRKNRIKTKSNVSPVHIYQVKCHIQFQIEESMLPAKTNSTHLSCAENPLYITLKWNLIKTQPNKDAFQFTRGERIALCVQRMMSIPVHNALTLCTICNPFRKENRKDDQWPVSSHSEYCFWMVSRCVLRHDCFYMWSKLKRPLNVSPVHIFQATLSRLASNEEIMLPIKIKPPLITAENNLKQNNLK